MTEKREIYCELLGSSTLLGKVVVTVDFGNAKSFWDAPDKLKDPKTGKPIKFQSMIDAMNYMATLGWTFVNAYCMTEKGSNVYHYVMRSFAHEQAGRR